MESKFIGRRISFLYEYIISFILKVIIINKKLVIKINKMTKKLECIRNLKNKLTQMQRELEKME